MDILFEVLKWVVIVLLAGFIGQFGRTMSHQVMDYFKKRREVQKTFVSQQSTPQEESPVKLPDTHVAKESAVLPEKKEKAFKDQEKAQKKAFKEEQKMKKKLNKSKAKTPQPSSLSFSYLSKVN